MPAGSNIPEALDQPPRLETLSASRSQFAILFAHPSAVLEVGTLTGSAKRALLAAWASDACAVEGQPAWRWLPGTPEPVAVDDVLTCLQALDRERLN